MPVRSCASTFASLLPKASYKVRVCRPGNAVSIFFRYFPTPSGTVLPICLFAFAMLIIVDLALENGFCGNLLVSVALRAAFLASFPR